MHYLAVKSLFLWKKRSETFIHEYFQWDTWVQYLVTVFSKTQLNDSWLRLSLLHHESMSDIRSHSFTELYELLSSQEPEGTYVRRHHN